ncbi:prolipoprotein diacylglyceryl transferase [Flectobacillus roseus]|uniref:Phosphatidylglycerol--prolipoprotein diacylglyceryl transferase n=1 Tax=Flectobacillus roseus TaxID=502259 RepID=A0ABT6YEH1_9BACT|nr:prolipoprotein diacylglyceryl transferase [Flectobacillus roseus]MDI9861992.1 prolipoprotein diacylglyceryl transferase [Flectobacillus roseus]
MPPIINWNIDPVIFMLTPTFPIKYYGILFALGITIAFLIVKKIYRHEGKSIEELDTLLIYIVLGTVLGARLGHCLFYEPEYYLNHPLEIILPFKKIDGAYHYIGFQGLASHGGTIGVLLSIIFYCIKSKTPLLQVLDRVAIAAPIAGTFIRLGNLMNSEIYGIPTNGTWGFIFLQDDTIPRHPTQLYEAVTYLCIFLFLWIIYQKTELLRKSGVMFGLFLMLVFTARFFLEFFKENQVAFENKMSLNMGQLLSLPFVILGVALLIWRLSSEGKNKM